MPHAMPRMRTVTMLLTLGLLPALAVGQTWDAGGGVDTDWDTAANWNPDGEPAAGASVIIDDSAVANGIALAFDTNSILDITFDAGITGALTVTDSGPGAVLVLGNGSAGTFTSDTDQAIAFDAGVVFDDGGSGSTFDVSDTDGNVDVSGVIDDGANTSTLTKTGGGTLTLSSAGNTYGGGTTIENGTLSISADSQLGDPAGGVTFGGGGAGILEVTVDGENSARTFTLDAGGTINVADVGETFQISGQITGTDSLNKDGDGTLLLSGAGNNWQGDAFVTAGTLRIAADERIPDTAALLLTAGTFDVNGQTETVGALSGDSGSTVAVGAGIFTFGGDDTNRNFSGAVSSDPGGTLNKNGSGWTYFNQDDSLAFQGTLNINEGELYIDTTFGDGANATAVVANGATLAGDGTFDGAVAVQTGGYIRPGLGLIGDFTVRNYNPAAGSFLEVQVSSTPGTGSPNNDHLKVTNNANLNGNGTVETILTEAPGNYLAGTRWRILQADTARNGQFAGVVGTGQAANFGWSLDYATDPNEVWLVLDSIVAYAAAARSSNQSAVAKTLDRVGGGTPSLAMREVFTRLNAMDDTTLRRALDEISPARQTANAQVTQSATRALGTAMTRRFEDLHDEKQTDDTDNPFVRMLRTGRGPDLAALGDSRDALALSSQPVQTGQVVHNRWSFWFRVLGDLGDMDGTDEQPGFRSSTVGVTFGADYRIVRGLVVGMSLSYAKSYFSHNDSLGNGEIDSFYQMFYGSFLYEGFYLDGSLGWGYHWYQNDRKMPALGGATAHSEHDGCQFVGYLGTGYDFTVEQWTFGPTMWMQYTHLAEDDYSESEAGALNLRFDSTTTDSFMTGLGAHVGTEVMWDWLKLKPDLRAEWLHEFQTDPQTVSARFNEPGGTLRVTGPDTQADAWRIGVHLDAVWTEEVTTFLDYTLTQDFGSGLTSNTFWGGMKIRF